MRCNSAPQYKRRTTCLQGVLTKELCKIADAAAENFLYLSGWPCARGVCICPTKVGPESDQWHQALRSLASDLLSKQENASRAVCVWAYIYAARRKCIVKFVGLSLVYVRAAARAREREMCIVSKRRRQQIKRESQS